MFTLKALVSVITGVVVSLANLPTMTRTIVIQNATTTQENIEALITPELKRIAFCESSLRQFNEDGSVLRGYVNPKDIGMFQISETYWGEKAEELGYDIYSYEGNVKMARWIHDNYGAKPWGWSRGCHGYPQKVASATSTES